MDDRARIVWLDVETTGLDPRRDALLAVGAVVMDATFRRLGEFEVYLSHPDPRGVIHAVNDADNAARVIAMHERSGLFERVAGSALSVAHARDAFVAFLDRWAPAVPRGAPAPVLAGNNPHFDRGFVDAHFGPETLARFSHRHLDVSALRVICELYAPADAVQAVGTTAHTPLRDLDAAAWQFAFYRRALFRPEFWGVPKLGAPAPTPKSG